MLLPFAALAATASLALAASAASPGAQISASSSQVKYGKPVRLSGAVPGIQDADVEIAFRRDGDSEWSSVDHAKTDDAGTYAAKVRPHATGEWRAQTPTGEPSAEQRIEVQSRIDSRLRRNVIAGRTVRLGGRVHPAGPGRKVQVKIGGRTHTTHTNKKGAFSVRWRAPHAGRYGVRISAAGNRFAEANETKSQRVTAFRRALASYYGPGLYGGALACGGRLTPGKVGVANKTLPCGTKLTLRYRGHSVNARVIDRGPYAGNREFDLTAATKRKLGFPSTGTVLSSR